MPDTEMPGPKSRTGPKIMIVIAVASLILGIGRCGFLGSNFSKVNDDYGLSGACFIVLGLFLLIAGVIWLQRRRSE